MEARSKHTLSMLLVGLMAGAGIVLLLTRSGSDQAQTAEVGSVESVAAAEATPKAATEDRKASVAEAGASPSAPVDSSDVDSSDVDSSDVDSGDADSGDVASADVASGDVNSEFTTSEELEKLLAPSIVRVLVHEQAVLYVNDPEVPANAP